MPNYHAPPTEGHMLQVNPYVEVEPEAGYPHASAAAREAFLDMKYGIRIHWGLYSLWNLHNESWRFLRMSRKRRQAYQQLYQQFNPKHFDADRWMAFFERVGLKCFAITTKHHEGFSLFDTQTRVRRRVDWSAPGGPKIEDCDLAYSVMDSPFKRDIIGELCQAAGKHGLKTDLYFSHPDWYDADFRPYSFHPLQTQHVFDCPEEYGTVEYVQGLRKPMSQGKIVLAPEPSPEETRRMMARHRQQLVELLSNYGQINMLCLDMWLGKAVWPELRETVKLLRQIQPDVMLRIRGIGNYGDYFTPEGFVPTEKAETDMPWMVIYPLGSTFSYEPVARLHKDAEWVIRNLIHCTATGGNFMLGIGPDADGWFHPRAVQVLESVGEWLKVNGEAVYATRPYTPWHEGEEVFFSQAKGGLERTLGEKGTPEVGNSPGAEGTSPTVYTFLVGRAWQETLAGKPLQLNALSGQPGLRVTLLGESALLPLSWRQAGDRLLVEMPSQVCEQAKRLSPVAGVIKIEYQKQ